MFGSRLEHLLKFNGEINIFTDADFLYNRKTI